MKLGVFGGTFNPIHNGHMETARLLLDRAGLDKVIFMVAGQPPHKEQQILDKYERLAMVQLAVASEARFLVSDLEINKEGESFTIDTMEALKEQYPKDELWFVTGADMFINVPSWHEGGRLLREYQFIAVNRDGSFEQEAYQVLFQQVVSTYHTKVMILDEPTPDISASMVRKRLSKGAEVRAMVPEPVFEYIKANRLYQDGGRET